MNAARNRAWNKEKIGELSATIRAELADISDPKERFQLCLEKIDDLEGASSADGPVQRFLWTVQALVHYEATGSIQDKQVRQLSQLAEAILKTEGISPSSSRLSFLYGHVRLALANIYRRTGDIWSAAWEKQLAYSLSQRMPAGGKQHQRFFMGISAARLGFIELTEGWLDENAFSELPDSVRHRAIGEKTKLLRLSGRTEQAKTVAEEHLKSIDDSGDRLEPQWEILCCEAQETGDITKLIETVKRGQSHHNEAYLMEAFLWSRATKERQWIQRYPSLKKLGQDPTLQFPKSDPLYKAIQILEKAYDGKVSYFHRLQEVKKIMTASRSAYGLEAEFLLYACVARWLSRNRSYWLMSLVLCKYQSLCRDLSEGRSTDILGILTDLSPWMADTEEAA